MMATVNFPSSHRRIQGFSLIELMIALVLGGLIIAAVGTVYLGSRQSFRTQDAMARIQEGARYAFETLSYDIRQVGFGCESVNTNPVDATWYNNLFKQPLLGYKNGSGLPSDVTDVVANTDAIMVLRADKRGEVRLTAPSTTAGNHNLENGGLAVVTEDYSDGTVYTASGAAGTSITLGGTPQTCQTSGTAVVPTANYRLLPLSANVYHIRDNANGVPSLYRETLRADGSTEAQEIIEGVEDMVITYGEDTSQATVAECPDDGCSADAYNEADAVTNWNRVVSVRVRLTMRSAEDNVAAAGGDGILRKTFTTTIAVRNRL